MSRYHFLIRRFLPVIVFVPCVPLFCQDVKEPKYEAITYKAVVSTEPLVLLKGWQNYGKEYQNAVVKRSDDICTLQGVIKGGLKGSVITKLSEIYRPPSTLIFNLNSGGAQGRVDVKKTGEVIFVEGTLVDGCLSLNGITFATGNFSRGALKFPTCAWFNGSEEYPFTNHPFELEKDDLLAGAFCYECGNISIIQGLIEEAVVRPQWSFFNKELRMYFDILAAGGFSAGLRPQVLIEKFREKPINKNWENTTGVYKLKIITDRSNKKNTVIDGCSQLAYLATDAPLSRHGYLSFAANAHNVFNRVDVGPDGYLYWKSGPRLLHNGAPITWLSLSGLVYACSGGQSLILDKICANVGAGYAPALCGKEGDFCWIQGLIKLDKTRLVPASKANEGRGTLLAKLPVGFPAPAKRLAFTVNAYDDLNQIDIFPNGEIRWIRGKNSGVLSLSGIIY